MAFQMSGPMLEMCILADLSREDSYGYKLTQSTALPLGLSESTLYPVLRRLRKSGCLDVYDVSHEGRNRRYYRITPQGRSYYLSLLAEWSDFVRKISDLIAPDGEDLPETPAHRPDKKTEKMEKIAGKEEDQL